MRNIRLLPKCATLIALLAFVVTLLITPLVTAQHMQQDEQQLRNEVQLRKSLYLPHDQAYLRAVHAAKDTVTINRVGGKFTPAEASDVLERLDIEQDGAALSQHFATSIDQEDAFGGLYVDHASGGQLVLQLVRTHPSIQGIISTLPKLRYPHRLRIEFVDWTEKRLEHQFKTISDVVEHYPLLLTVGIDTPTNQVVVTTKTATSSGIAGDTVDKRALPPDLATLLSDPAVVVRQAAVKSVPTALMGGNGWNTTGAGHNTCTLGFEVVHLGKAAMTTAGHCVAGMANGANAYHFSTQIGTFSGSRTDGCASNSGTCIDVGVLNMNSAATATDDIFRGGGQSILDIAGSVEQYSYVNGYVRCFYGVSSGLLCGAITQSSYTVQASHNLRWYRDIFFTDPAAAGGDSGGPVYRTDNATSASVAGILGGNVSISGVTNGNDAYHSKWYNAQSYFGFTLVTTD